MYSKSYFVTKQVINDEENDELATYFKCEVIPKVLITSSDRSKVVRQDKNAECKIRGYLHDGAKI